MGNRPGLKDLGNPCSEITLDELENAVMQAQASFGQANHIMMSTAQLNAFMSVFGGRYSEFKHTPWEHADRLTKREYKVATLHAFLTKLKAFKFTEEEFLEVRNKTVKRLKRANWARYQNAKGS